MQKEIKNILETVKKDIKPTKKEEKELLAKIDDVLKKINKKLKNAKAILGGSGAKKTWLKKTHDADLFVLFDYTKYKSQSAELSGILEKALKKVFPNINKLHGSRDYFQVKLHDFIFEIVPILNIKKAEQAKNITDVSPLHATWVKKHSKLADDIRLTKQFCKAADVYGAESYIGGFSGYICEILTISYGGFLNLIKNAANWKDKVVIDVEGYFKNKNVFDELNRSKLHSPLIIIDPVQKGRNAAAAVTKERFDSFRKKCREFIKNPSPEFFVKKPLTLDYLKKLARSDYLIILEIEPKSGKEDVIGSKLVKAFSYITIKLKEHDFVILENGWEWDKESKAIVYFIIKKQELSLKKLRSGPPLKALHHVKRFKQKYKKTFEKDNRLYAEIKREFLTPDELIKEVIDHVYIKEKIKKISTAIF